jgi:hypothetical protein
MAKLGQFTQSKKLNLIFFKDHKKQNKTTKNKNKTSDLDNMSHQHHIAKPTKIFIALN